MRLPAIPGAFAALALLAMPAAAALDIDALWNHRDPAGTERRFRDALATAQGEDALLLQTQIARTFGLRRDFEEARRVLAAIAPQVATASPLVRARYELELGRTYASATHTPEERTSDHQARARSAFEASLAAAREARRDELAIDAIHMLAFVDTAPADQLRWAQEALAVVEASTQPAAKKWEASIRNNIGYALHQQGRLEEALQAFEQALAIRQRGTSASSTRVAWWMVAWTLRGLHRADEALAIQLRLEREGDEAKEPDPYVFEELEALYRAQGDDTRAAHYAQRKAALKP